MKKWSTESSPVRIAIIGAGPAGFYTAEHLLKQRQFNIQVDLFDRLPTPYGLVRGGVAPDHQKIKSVTKAYERTAQMEGFRYFGYLEFGRDLNLDDLRPYYHQIVFTIGTQAGKKMDIPGADFDGSHTASDFVSWYNGHPDFREKEFDLTQERVAVIGVGNVALDVARILCLTPAELARTDMPDYAIEALRRSRVKEVYILGRRGPAQAAFSNPELKELRELEDASISVLPAEAELDALSQADLLATNDRAEQAKVELLQGFAIEPSAAKSRQLTLRFLVSPTQIIGDVSGRVTAIRLVKNTLIRTETGRLQPQETNQTEEIPVGLVFHAIGYRGLPLPGLPFDDRWGVLPNHSGRIFNPQTKAIIPGLYAAGWIKRGPSGLIGTNKQDALETVECMLADLTQGISLDPTNPEAAAAEGMIRQRQPEYLHFDDWLQLDRIEVARGQAEQRPRVKITDIDEMLSEVDYPASAGQ